MIFHNESDYGHHMMDIDLGSWIIIIVFAGLIILAAIILVFLVISKSGKKSQHIEQREGSGKANEIVIQELKELSSEKIKYCHNCGKKLNSDTISFCSHCGVEL